MSKLSLFSLLMVFLTNVSFAVRSLEKSVVTFKAPTNMGSVVTGKGVGIDGNIGDATFELKKLDTGMALRNQHMLEDLHADKFPVARIEIQKDGRAMLTLNGITKPIDLRVDAKKYQFDVMLPEFGLKGRRYLGVGVQDKVEVTVEIL